MKTDRVISLPNFLDTDETICKCGCGLDVEREILIRLLAFIFILERKHAAPIKMTVTSGARCYKHNLAEGGGKQSQHPMLCAVDGKFSVLRGGKWLQIPNSIIRDEAVKSGLFTGIGYQQYVDQGKNLVHLDCRAGNHVAQW